MTTLRTARLGRPPLALMVLSALGVALLGIPLLALVAELPLGSATAIWTQQATREALWLSLWTSTLAAGFCLLLGLPLAWVLARVEVPGRGLLRALVTVPLVLPPVVAGVALLAALGRRGLLGEQLAVWGLQIPYTSAAVVLAHTFVALPFFVLAAEGALRALDTDTELAAATLGATRWVTFTRVTLPAALPGILAGTVLAWARSLGEFGATITFAGNYPGSTRTLPLEVYTRLQADRGEAITLSVLLLAVSLAVLVLLRERWWGPR